jgi:hypothetical protein
MQIVNAYRDVPASLSPPSSSVLTCTADVTYDDGATAYTITGTVTFTWAVRALADILTALGGNPSGIVSPPGGLDTGAPWLPTSDQIGAGNFVVLQSCAGTQKDWLYLFGAPPTASGTCTQHYTKCNGHDPDDPWWVSYGEPFPPDSSVIVAAGSPVITNPFVAPGIAKASNEYYDESRGEVEPLPICAENKVLGQNYFIGGGAAGTGAATVALERAEEEANGIHARYRLTFPEDFFLGTFTLNINGTETSGEYPLTKPSTGVGVIPFLLARVAYGDGVSLLGAIYPYSSKVFVVEMRNFGDIINSVECSYAVRGTPLAQGSTSASFGFTPDVNDNDGGAAGYTVTIDAVTIPDIYSPGTVNSGAPAGVSGSTDDESTLNLALS